MIDNIKIRYDIKYNTASNDLINWIHDNYPEKYEEVRNSFGSTSYRTEIKNLKIYINTHYIFIHGSLTKFFLGNNVDELELNEIGKAFALINDHLNNLIDIRDGYVRNMEICKNFKMKYSPPSYISRFHKNSSKKFSNYNGESIDTSNGSRGMKIYDKTEEVKKKAKKGSERDNIPANVLRLETKVAERHVFEKYFGDRLPTVECILKELQKLPEIWYEEYTKLDKEYDIEVNCVQNKKDFINYLIVKVGFENCKKIIDQSYDLSLIDVQNKRRYYKSVQQAFKSNKGEIKVDDLMKELDEMVAKWYDENKMQFYKTGKKFV